MIDIIWSFFIIIAIVYGIVSGNIESINNSIFSSTESSIKIIVTLFCNMCLWSGIMNIASKLSLIDKLCKLLEPIVNFLFYDYKDDKKIKKTISLNMISNMLGIGNAATPLGIEAMKNMQNKNKDKTKMNKSMMLFILINTASIQIIPTTMISIRKSLGANNPVDIIIPVWISTVFAATCGVITLKTILMRRK